MESKRTLRTLLVIIISFSVYYFLFLNFKTIKFEFDKVTHQGLTSYILTYCSIGIPIFIGTYILNRKINVFINLGLSKNLWTGILASILFTIPMFAGGLILFNFNQQIDWENLIAATIVAGFMEELYFRGFLFGQVFRNTNIGFIPAIFVGALIFALGHLYQSQDVNE